ncbi:MAG: carboxypeptidase regulatory-like domain-containing protein, partial [Thermodesulfobacteriota bacterium]
PALIVVDAGNNQEGIAGQSLPRPFVAAVVDSGSNRLGNVEVTFTVTQGGGNFAGRPSVTVPTDSDGRAQVVLTLGPEEGFDNNAVKATFPGNAGAPATFVASGKIAGDAAATQISGVVLDNTNLPVPGVTLHIDGTALTTQSDEQGQFVLRPAPVGHVKLIADGATAQRPGTWPELEYELVTIPGHNNTIGMPIYLLPLDLSHGLLVDETQGGTLTLPEVPGFALTILPGSVTFPDGTKRGLVSVTVVHADKVPMVPNFGQQPRFIITIQPAGTHFNPPAALTLPNVDGLSPGQKTEMYSFDHDLGQFVSIGPGTVSEDGTVVQSDPGVGVIKGGWHCGGDPSPVGAAEATFAGGPQDLAVAVGKQVLVTVIGAPGPGADIPFGWTSTDPEVVAIPGFENFLGQEEVRSVALLRGVTPGTATVTAQYTAQPTEEDEPGQTATAEVTVNVIDAQVVDADVTQDAIAVRLEPSGVSGTLKLELLGTTTHVIREEARASGTYQETFDIPNLAEGEYTKVRATWTVGEASAIGELDYHIKVLGQYRQSEYNTPDERQCTGSPTLVFVLSSPTTCFDVFEQGPLLKSDFASQVNTNGSGLSIRFGDIKALAATRCRNVTQNRPPEATIGNSFVEVPFIDGACANIPLSNTTVAACLARADLRGTFSCGDRVYIHGFGVKTVTDHCPACCNANGQRQLDNYTLTDTRCEAGHDFLPDTPITIQIFE